MESHSFSGNQPLGPYGGEGSYNTVKMVSWEG
jgi:hypothetical protein